jgi:nucleoside phosphorylase
MSREQVRTVLDEQIKAAEDLAAQSDLAVQHGGWRDWIFLFSRWREDTLAALRAMYQGDEEALDLDLITRTAEHSSPSYDFPYRRRALDSGLETLRSLVARLELAIEPEDLPARPPTAVAQHRPAPPHTTSPTALRVVILTALSLEYKAVRAHLTNLVEDSHPQGNVYEQGQFSANGRSWAVTIVEAGAHNANAAAQCERVIQHVKPAVALFVGVAGGLKDVALGHVVAATKVYGYESGKAATVFHPRPEVGRSTHRMIERARAEARRDDWLLRLGGLPSEPLPTVFVGPIAAGDKVVAATDAPMFTFLKATYGDALAVEMEGYGFLEATHASDQVQALVVRGISDLVNGKSDTDSAGWQQIAARHASAFAFEILAKLDLPVASNGPVEPGPRLPSGDTPSSMPDSKPVGRGGPSTE